jgi:hypothetical protein
MSKYILAWIPMLLIAIVNGAVRELCLVNYLGELRAHQASSATGIVLLGVYIWIIIRNWRPASATMAIAIGLAWLSMTVAFEFIFGVYVRGLSWGQMFHEYNLLAGRVWTPVLAWVTIAPYLFYRLQNRNPQILSITHESGRKLAQLGGTENSPEAPTRRSTAES